MENLVFRGKNDEEKVQTQDLLEKQRENKSERIENEIEKGEEDRKMIARINEIMKEFFSSLGLPEPELVDVNNIHYFTHEHFHERNPKETHAHGFYQPHSGLMEIDVSQFKDVYTKFCILLHEIVHSLSFQKFNSVQPYEGDTYARTNRIGYHMRGGKWGFEGGFTRFNEGVVDATTYHLVETYKDNLEKEFNIKDIPEYKEMPYGYYINIVAWIMTLVAEEKGIPVEEVRDNIFRGQFDGNMMHLRDIEKVYGKEALRVLAALDNPDGELRQEVKPKIAKFFASKDPEERERLKNEVFSVKDWNQRAFHEKRDKKAKGESLQEQVEKFKNNQDEEGRPQFTGNFELAAILSSDVPYLNVDGIEAVRSTPEEIDFPVNSYLTEYAQEFQLFQDLCLKYGISLKKYDDVLNEEGSPVWQEMSEKIKDVKKLKEFRRELEHLEVKKKNFEYLVKQFYEKTEEPQSQEEELVVEIVDNAKIMRLKGDPKEMKRFETWIKEWYMM